MSAQDRDHGRTTAGDAIRDASELLLELAGADLLPEEYTEQAEALGTRLASIAEDMAEKQSGSVNRDGSVDR